MVHKYDCFPKIISYDDNQYEIVMTYCGLTLKKIPNLKSILYKIGYENILKQISKISDYLDENFIQHFDLSKSNICILDNKIYIIDFVCNNLEKRYFSHGENYKRMKSVIDIELNKDTKLYYNIFDQRFACLERYFDRKFTVTYLKQYSEEILLDDTCIKNVIEIMKNNITHFKKNKKSYIILFTGNIKNNKFMLKLDNKLKFVYDKNLFCITNKIEKYIKKENKTKYIIFFDYKNNLFENKKFNINSIFFINYKYSNKY